MNGIRKALIVWVTLIFSPAIYAADGAYLSLGGGLMNFDDSADVIKPGQVIGRVGIDYSEFFSVGAEAGVSLLEDDFAGDDLAVVTLFLYVRGDIPVGEKSSIYGMIGPSNVSVSSSANNYNNSVSDSDIGFGIGFQTELQKVNVFIDYISYFNDNGVDVSSVNAGLVIGF